MDRVKTVTQLKGLWLHFSLQFAIWLHSFYTAALDPGHISSAYLLARPPENGIFKPFEIPPAVIPNISFPVGSSPPVYTAYPPTYDPVLTGRCPVNFSALSSIIEITATDCDQHYAGILGNVICCPQFSSLLHIFQGFHSINSDELILQNAVADDCFQDLISILVGKGASSSIPTICPVKSSNLTGGSCPVKDVTSFEKIVNTTKLLESCSDVDQLKECCRPICQPAVTEAVVKISGMQSFMNDNKVVRISEQVDLLNDCKGVVYSYISRKLTHESANAAFRILSACKVNKACPLSLKQPSEVIAACRNVAAPSPSCCSSLNTYIAGIQRQMLITNKQAIMCSITLGSMLRKGGVMTNIYELCDVELKDFSLQASGSEGCLLQSLPANMMFDNSSGLIFTCDLRDNIEAPWPSSSSMTSISLCAPEMSLPALPTQTAHNYGRRGCGVDFIALVLTVLFSAQILLQQIL